MLSALDLFRKFRRQTLALIALVAVAACDVPGVVTGNPVTGAQETVPVALLLPQSAGDSGPSLSRSFENAARLAMDDIGEVDIDLRVYDTGGTSAGAATAANAAVVDGAKIILGPVFGEAANAAGSAVAGRGVSVVSFSNNPAVAGGNVFILGSTFQNTANRLVGFAAQRGKGDILVVHGENAAEQSGYDAISRAIASSNARLAGSVSYPLTQQGVISAVPEIADRVRQTGAQSVFVTSGNDGAVPFLAELLPENGIDNTVTQFIGLQRLDIPSGALALDGLQGAWFATPSPGLAQQFRARYSAAFGGAPHPLASLAYDGIAAIGALASTGAPLGPSGLTRSNGFLGVNGVFRFRPNGTNERGLAVAMIQDKQVVIIDPAPRSFGIAGF